MGGLINVHVDHSVPSPRTGRGISDYSTVLCDLHLDKPPPVRKILTSPAYKRLDMKRLCENKEASYLSNGGTDLDGLVDHYNHTLYTQLDDHALVKQHTVVA